MIAETRTLTRQVPTPRIAGIDGLRAISIALVLGGNLAGTRYGYSVESFARFGDLANLGVRVFFVISGYLITILLLAEHAETGRISLPWFYVRRSLRILPAFFAFMSAVVVSRATGVIGLRPGDLVHALTFTMNVHPDRSWWVGHLWSLSVEEQFYLIWPVSLVVFGLRRGLMGAAAVIALAPVTRVSIALWWPGQLPSMGESFPTIADAIATGCLAAGIQRSLSASPWFQRILTGRATLFVAAVAIVALNHKAGGRLRIAAFETAINVLIALVVLRATLNMDGMFSRLLSSRGVVFVGTLSYSLYLWQQLFLNGHSESWACAFPLNLVLTVSTAIASYVLVERPTLNLRRRLEQHWAAGRSIAVHSRMLAGMDPLS
jgi:peptidoglycan/LPS O-acetylase OafA/YrhL